MGLILILALCRQTERIQRTNDLEVAKDLWDQGSWHDQFKDSPNIYVGNISKTLSEGDIRAIFSQYGVVKNVNLLRKPDTGLSRGFAFLSYEDPRSARLAVDNLNGITVVGQKIRVDHASDEKDPKSIKQHRSSKVIDVSDEMLNAFIDESTQLRVGTLDEDQPVQTAVNKRPRTEEERSLRALFKAGKISEQEYLERKARLKKKLQQQRSSVK